MAKHKKKKKAHTNNESRNSFQKHHESEDISLSSYPINSTAQVDVQNLVGKANSKLTELTRKFEISKTGALSKVPRTTSSGTPTDNKRLFIPRSIPPSCMTPQGGFQHGLNGISLMQMQFMQ
jgi:hypothetical protein